MIMRMIMRMNIEPISDKAFLKSKLLLVSFGFPIQQTWPLIQIT